MKNSTIIILFLIILFSCKTTFTLSQEKKISKKAVLLYNESVELSFSGNVDASILKLNQAIDIEPSYYKALKSLADLYQVRKKDYRKAIEIHKKVIENVPSSISVYYNKALAEFKLKDYENAKGSINKFLSYLDIKGNVRLRAEQILKNIEFVKQADLQTNNINFINLGSNINSANGEYFPSITSDNQFLYYTVKMINDKYPTEDIYFSEKVNGKWTSTKKISRTINSTFNEGAHCITSSGKYLLFASDNYKYGNKGRFDIFISKKVGNNWKLPVNLGDKINSRTWDSQPVLSADSKQLFFVSSKKGGVGGADIYLSTIDETGKFGEPVNLGEAINTIFDEQRPYLHPDGKTLYFSSAGHPGMGEGDLFKSTLGEDGKWSKPLNLGYPINTSEAEMGIFVSADGQTAFISSDREGGFGGQDIYQFELPKNLKPEMVTYLKGIVSDKEDNSFLKANIKLYDLETGIIYKTFSSDEINGSFLATIVADKDYAFETDAKGYLPFSENISLKKIETNEPFIFNVNLQKIESGKEITLKNIFFNTNEFTLLDISKVELDYFVGFLKKNLDVKIEIGGHTDNVGSASSNKTLSENRAKSVLDYLVLKGIDISRLSSKGYGDTKPTNSNETEEGRTKNRRTSFKVL